jgi:hypothetical protein
MNLQTAKHKIKPSILQTRRQVVVSLTQTCHIIFVVSVREEQVELGVEIITLSFRPASYCVEGKRSLQRGRTKRHFLQRRRWHNQFKFVGKQVRREVIHKFRPIKRTYTFHSFHIRPLLSAYFRPFYTARHSYYSHQQPLPTASTHILNISIAHSKMAVYKSYRFHEHPN